MDPPQEQNVAENESAGAAKQDAEMGEQPPEEAAAAGGDAEGRDSADLVNRSNLSWSSSGSIFSNT